MTANISSTSSIASRIFKDVAKKNYKLAAEAKAKSLITTLDGIHMKKYYRYFIKQTHHLPFEQMMSQPYAPLEHIFDNHEFCNPAWCHKKRD